MTEGKLNKILSEGLEILKSSAKELGDTVGPAALIEKALNPGAKPNPSEVTAFLQKSAPDRTPQQIAQMAKEAEEKREKDLAQARNNIRLVTPVHMRLPPKPPQLRPAEQIVQDLERKKALQVEAQRKQTNKPLIVPLGPVKKIIGMVRRKAATGFENKGSEGLQKDTKIG